MDQLSILFSGIPGIPRHVWVCRRQPAVYPFCCRPGGSANKLSHAVAHSTLMEADLRRIKLDESLDDEPMTGVRLLPTQVSLKGAYAQDLTRLILVV